jgi:hypothetical protein
MAVTTVVPNATASGTTLFTVTGAASINAALSDGSDSSYIMKTSSIVGSADAIVDFGTTTISSSQRVKRVRVRARCSTPTTSGKINIYLGSRLNNQNYFYSGLAIRGINTSATDFTGPYFASAPNGQDWTQSAINGLRAKVTEYKDTSDIGKTYELYIDVDVAAQPTVTVSAPTGTVTTSAAPDVTWAYADTDNETQSYYQIKVFSAAQYGAGGFDAETSTATWDSGEIASSDQTGVVGTLLLPATYRTYVRVAKSINGTPFWSTFAYSQFTISFTAPTVPTMVANWSDALGRASFTLTGAAPTGYSSQYYQIQRSDDSGTTYSLVRNASEIIPNVSYVGTAVDYEAPREIIANYRCRSVGVDSSSNEFPSAWGTVQLISITSDSTWWFKAITNPSLNKGSIRVLRNISITVEEPNAVFRPLGESRPIVVSGLIQGQDGSYSIKTINSTEWDNILPLLDYQGIILAQDPYGDQKYIRIVTRDWVASNNGVNVHRDITVRYVEVNGNYVSV